MVTLWIIYDHPRDYPDHFVVRPQTVCPGGIVHGAPVLCETLDEARESVPPGLYRLPRDPEDDQVIVEAWI